MEKQAPAPLSATSQSSALTLTLARGLQLLRAFRAQRTPLSNADLVKRTGMSRSSVSRLTITMVNLGYLRRASGGTAFELAWGGFDIGYAYAKSNPVAQQVNPLLQELADKLHVSVALAIPNELDMLYLACRTSAQISTLRLDVGSLLPMGLTSIGRAWLWAAPPDERERCMRALLEAAGPKAKELQARIQLAFDDLNETGVCMAVGEYQQGAYGIALPIRVGRSRTLMTLSCGAAEHGVDAAATRARIVPALKQASAQVTALLQSTELAP